jgi:genome maintenance exonuclease 1
MPILDDAIQLTELECVTGENGGRYYVTPEGMQYPSTTTVVNWDKREFFAEWRKTNPQKSKMILNRGTLVHQMVEDYIMTGLTPQTSEDETTNRMFRNLSSMVDTLDEVKAVEAPLYSDLLKMAGRVDCVGIMNGEYCIIDFKTSSKMKREEWLTEYWCQATAYAIMWQERTGIAIPRIAIMMASEDGKKKIFTKDSMSMVPLLKEKIDRFSSFR